LEPTLDLRNQHRSRRNVGAVELGQAPEPAVIAGRGQPERHTLSVMSKRRQAPGELERVRRFVNTREVGHVTDRLTDPPALVAWLEQEGLTPTGTRATRADLDRAVALREALRAILLAHNGADGADGSASLAPDAGGVSGGLGGLVAIVHESISQGTWARLKVCRDDSCEWAFYDHTKNRSGTWCSMEGCGNRAKARAFRERRAAPAS